MACGAGRPMAGLILSGEERSLLERQTRRRQVSRSLSERCRMVLRCAEGVRNKVVAAELGGDRRTVGKWRRRFLRDRIDRAVGRSPGRGRPGGIRRRADAPYDPARRHPPVDPPDGQGERPFADHGPAHSERLRAAAAPFGNLQVDEIRRRYPRRRQTLPSPDQSPFYHQL